MLGPVQVREAAAEQAGGTEASAGVREAAEDQEGSDEAGSALGHLISLYGAQDSDQHHSTEPKDGQDGSKSSPGHQNGTDRINADLATHGPTGEVAVEKETSLGEQGWQQADVSAANGLPAGGEGGREVAKTGGFSSAATQAQSAARQPPAEVQGIVSKLMAFVKVRLGPLVPLWRRSLLWSWGARRDAYWRAHLAAAILMANRR